MNSIILKPLKSVNLKSYNKIISNEEEFQNDAIIKKSKKPNIKMSKKKIMDASSNAINNHINVNSSLKTVKVKILPPNIPIFYSESSKNIRKKSKSNKPKYITLETDYESPNKKLSIKELDKIKYIGIANLNVNMRAEQNAFYSSYFKNPYINLLELFPEFGLLSCLINNKLINSFNHIVYEPRAEYIEALNKNKSTHNSYFLISTNKINFEDLTINTLLINISEATQSLIYDFLIDNKFYISFYIDSIFIEFNDDIYNGKINNFLTELLFKKEESTEKRELWKK